MVDERDLHIIAILFPTEGRLEFLIVSPTMSHIKFIFRKIASLFVLYISYRNNIGCAPLGQCEDL